MAKKKDPGKPVDLDLRIRQELDEAFAMAEAYFVTHNKEIPPVVIEKLQTRFIDALERMAN